MAEKSSSQQQARTGHEYHLPACSVPQEPTGELESIHDSLSSKGRSGLGGFGASSAGAAASKHASHQIAADRTCEPAASTAKMPSAAPPSTVLHGVLDRLEAALTSSSLKQLEAALHAADKALGTAKASDAGLTQVGFVNLSLQDSFSSIT